MRTIRRAKKTKRNVSKPSKNVRSAPGDSVFLPLKHSFMAVDTSFDEGKIEIAAQMKAKGIDLTLIAEITGFSIAEIEKL